MGTYVPESQQDTKWKIWNLKYRVRVPNNATRSADHIRLFGTPDSGDSRRDFSAANELLDTYISIAQMVSYHHEGILVRLVKASDARPIYELVVEYLSQWKAYIGNSLVHRPDAPYDDLIAMNNFIQVIYPHAEPQLSTAMEESWLSKRVTSLSRGLTIKGDPPPELYQQDAVAMDQPQAQPKVHVAEKMFSNRKRW